jgi:hypothetical protein
MELMFKKNGFFVYKCGRCIFITVFSNNDNKIGVYIKSYYRVIWVYKPANLTPKEREMFLKETTVF